MIYANYCRKRVIEMESYICFNGVSMSFQTKYQRVDLFKHLDLSIHQNEFIVILGRSGSGKSTILNLIAGFLRPTSGAICIDGNDINKLTESQVSGFRNQRIGYVFQFFNLIDQFNAIENVMVPLLIAGYSKRAARERASDLLSVVSLTERRTHFPFQLSGGEQQRVAIARALANNPEIILADEPTGNLDSSTSESILAQLDQIHKSGKTVIVVTHDTTIANYATRIINMKELSQ